MILFRKTAILAAALLLSLFSYAQLVEKIEPPFWWSEMKNPNLQIMVYGDKVSNYDINIDQEGILKSIEPVKNENYVFINITIPKNFNKKSFKINFLKDGETAESIKYQIKERKKSDKFHQGFDQSDVIYLLMPDRFANGDTLNDNSNKMIEQADRTNPDGRHGGDIQGIINHLDYFEDLE
jgi:hypothetical protein